VLKGGPVAKDRGTEGGERKDLDPKGSRKDNPGHSGPNTAIRLSSKGTRKGGKRRQRKPTISQGEKESSFLWKTRRIVKKNLKIFQSF